MSKIAIITGTTRGLGRAIGCAFADAGWRVLSISRPQFDLANIDCDLLDSVLNAASPADVSVLVLNAAHLDIRPFSVMSHDDIRSGVAVNVTANILIASLYFAHFPKGRLVNVTSGNARVGKPQMSMYGTGKAAMEGFTRALRADGYDAIDFDPGIMDTDMQRQIRESGYPEREKFITYKADGALKAPEVVAKRLLESVT